MNEVRISDDERLITLTKTAYDKVQSEVSELKRFQHSKTLRIVSEIDVYPTIRRDYNNGNYYDRIERYDINRRHLIDVPYEYPGEAEPNAVLLDSIKRLVDDAKDGHDKIYQEIVARLVELNGTLEKSREEVHKNKREVDRIYASVPKILRWIFKQK